MDGNLAMANSQLDMTENQMKELGDKYMIQEESWEKAEGIFQEFTAGRFTDEYHRDFVEFLKDNYELKYKKNEKKNCN